MTMTCRAGLQNTTAETHRVAGLRDISGRGLSRRLVQGVAEQVRPVGESGMRRLQEVLTSTV